MAVALCSLLWGCSEPDVVTLGPGMTEIVYALGQGDRVAATDNESDYPLVVDACPKLGQASAPDLEALSTYHPSYIFLGKSAPTLIPYCSENNILLYPISINSVDDLMQTIQDMGTTLSVGKRATGLCSSIMINLDQIRTSVQEVNRLKVFLCIRRQRGQIENLPTVNGHTLISDLLTLAGGDNIYADAELQNFSVSIAEVIEKQPDIIIEILPDFSLTRNQEVAYYQDWFSYKELPAVQSGRVYYVSAQYTLRPGPRVIRTARTLAKCLHPETQR